MKQTKKDTCEAGTEGAHTGEAAKELNISRNKICKWTDNGLIGCMNRSRGEHRIINIKEAKDYLEKQLQKPSHAVNSYLITQITLLQSLLKLNAILSMYLYTTNKIIFVLKKNYNLYD